jgi:hypothetical protein
LVSLAKSYELDFFSCLTKEKLEVDSVLSTAKNKYRFDFEDETK